MIKGDSAKAKETQTKKLICDLFPLIPASNINSYVHRHVINDVAEIIAHFLTIKEPTGKAPTLAVEGMIARARIILREKEKEVVETEELKYPKRKEGLKKMIFNFRPVQAVLTLAEITLDEINKFRLSKKRPKLILESDLSQISFYIANEIMEGNFSLDNKDWSQFIETDTDVFKDTRVASGFLFKTNDPLSSIIKMMTREPQWKALAFSSQRFCGIGFAISKINAVFIAMIVTEIE